MEIAEATQQRLARIRSDNEQWLATTPEAKGWDTTFLLFLVDRLQEEIRKHKCIQ